MKLTDKFLVIYLTSLSVFRIDFLGGNGNFSLTPALLLSLFLVPVLGIILLSGNLSVKKNVAYFMLMLFLFAGWCIITIVPIRDFIQVKRLVLFLIIILSTVSFIILFSRSNHIKDIFERFCLYFISIYLLFSAIDVIIYTIPQSLVLIKRYLPFYDTELSHIGYYIIRLKGGFIDANVGGFFMIFLFLILHYLDIGKRMRIIFSILIFCTFSKSAIGTLLFLYLLIWLSKLSFNNIKINFSTKLKYANIKLIFIGLFFAGSFFFLLTSTNIAERVSSAVEARLSEKDGSTSIHLALIKEGLNFLSDNTLYLIKGYGFGSSSVLTQKFFPGDKYANFHSEYITFLVELGIIGTLIYLGIYLIPAWLFIFNKIAYKNLFLLLALVAFAMQNVLYQQYLFHYYWVFIGMIWVLPSLTVHNEHV